VVNSEGRLANVLVYVSAGAPSVPAPGNAAPPLLDQVRCMFEPYMLAVQTGQPFQIRNSDPELHNIHATPKINQEFNFAQPVRGQSTMKSFARPETFIRIKCDVHPWMFAYVSVLDHPWFAITGTNGGFRLPRGLPAGRYTLTAAHHKSGSLSQQIDFRPGEPKAVEFQFNVPDATQAQSTGARPAR
jgi:plastocyanin